MLGLEFGEDWIVECEDGKWYNLTPNHHMIQRDELIAVEISANGKKYYFVYDVSDRTCHSSKEERHHDTMGRAYPSTI